MRSKTVQRVLDNTPSEVVDFVDRYAEEYIDRASLFTKENIVDFVEWTSIELMIYNKGSWKTIGGKEYSTEELLKIWKECERKKFWENH